MRLVIKLRGTDNFVEGFAAHAERCRASRAHFCMNERLFVSVDLLSALHVLSSAFGCLAASHIIPGHARVLQLFENGVEAVTIGCRLMVLLFLGEEVRALRDAKAHRFTEGLILVELRTVVVEDVLCVLLLIVQEPGPFRERVKLLSVGAICWVLAYLSTISHTG